MGGLAGNGGWRYYGECNIDNIVIDGPGTVFIRLEIVQGNKDALHRLRVRSGI